MTQDVQAALTDRAPPGALKNASQEARGPKPIDTTMNLP